MREMRSNQADLESKIQTYSSSHGDKEANVYKVTIYVNEVQTRIVIHKQTHFTE